MEHHPVLSARVLSAVYPEPELSRDHDKRWIMVRGNEVIFSAGPACSVVRDQDPHLAGIGMDRYHYLGYADGIPYFAAEVPREYFVPEGYSLSGIRELYGRISDDELALAAYAVQITGYDRSTRYCGMCGAGTRSLRTQRAKRCTGCGHITYPRISPAIIVLVKRGDEILLARSPRFPSGVFSVIAGFVGPGENLEETVRREVREEVGIEVTNIRYFGSEPWPFPDSLMLGFSADYAGGGIVIDKKEIESAGWFNRDNLPLLPSPLSISRVLIDTWFAHGI